MQSPRRLKHEDRKPPHPIGVAPLLAATGCDPTVDVLGVFFPGWLVSTVVGVALSYGVVVWLARRPQTRELADSGLFFVSLVGAIALTMWWGCFSGA
ncbi:MAG: hypothetical protein JRH10_19195 [Deltaproteobacteria bacterium]|nr:hypothetical protein [Deltaproteobacteria bacterium]MBW2447099.1 hypothetical protein [Deltaproteobacteria bacterium]